MTAAPITSVVDANVVIAFLDASNVLHADAVALLSAYQDGAMVMHDITVTEVLVDGAKAGPDVAQRLLASILAMGIATANPTSPLDISLLRATTGLPIPDCLVLHTAGTPGSRRILTFDNRLAAQARSLGHTVLPMELSQA